MSITIHIFAIDIYFNIFYFCPLWLEIFVHQLTERGNSMCCNSIHVNVTAIGDICITCIPPDVASAK